MAEQRLPVAGDIWRHKKTGGQYLVIGPVQVEVRIGYRDHPEERLSTPVYGWADGFLYESKNGDRYVRVRERFLDRFEFVRHEEPTSDAIPTAPSA